MALSQDFMEKVSDHQMGAVYRRLTDIMPIDPSLSKLDEMLKYAEANIPDLYQAHDGEALKSSSSDWTNTYYDQQRYKLEKNFSRERLDLVRIMTKHHYADTIAYRKEAEQKREQERHPQPSNIHKKQIGGGVALAGLFAAGVGIGVGSAALTVVGAVVAVGGIYVVVADSTKK